MDLSLEATSPPRPYFCIAANGRIRLFNARNLFKLFNILLVLATILKGETVFLADVLVDVPGIFSDELTCG